MKKNNRQEMDVTDLQNDIKALYSDIDKCITDLINARVKKDAVGVSNAQHRMESLMDILILLKRGLKNINKNDE